MDNTERINQLAQQFIAQHSWLTLKALVLANLVPILAFAGCYLLVVLLGHRSQVDEWCQARPRLAGIIKLARGLGVDPWLIIQGLSLLIKAKLPAYLSKLLPTALLALACWCCTMSLESARTAGIQKRAAAVKTTATTAAQPSDRTECNRLDGIRTTWGYVEISVTPVAPLALGIAAIPGVEGKTQNALLIGGGVAALAAGFAAAEKHVWTNEWTETCSANGPQ